MQRIIPSIYSYSYCPFILYTVCLTVPSESMHACLSFNCAVLQTQIPYLDITCRILITSDSLHIRDGHPPLTAKTFLCCLHVVILWSKFNLEVAQPIYSHVNHLPHPHMFEQLSLRSHGVNSSVMFRPKLAHHLSFILWHFFSGDFCLCREHRN